MGRLLGLVAVVVVVVVAVVVGREKRGSSWFGVCWICKKVWTLELLMLYY